MTPITPDRRRERMVADPSALLPAREARRLIKDPEDTTPVQLSSIDSLPLDDIETRRRKKMQELRQDPIEAPDWMEDPGLMVEWREVVDQFEDALDTRAAMQIWTKLHERRQTTTSLSQDEERRYEAARSHVGQAVREFRASLGNESDGLDEDRLFTAWERDLASKTGAEAFDDMQSARNNLQDALERKLQDPKNIRVGEMAPLTLPLSRENSGSGDMTSGQWVAVSEDVDRSVRGGGRFLTLESVDRSLPAQRVAVERIREVYQRELDHIRSRRYQEVIADPRLNQSAG